MNLIIGSTQVTPDAIIRTRDGVEAVLRGAALVSLLNAAFHGAGTIEILGGDLSHRRMEVTAIDMHGATTKVSMVPAAGPSRLM